MQQPTLDAILQSASVPSMPAVAARCYEITQDAQCSYSDLVAALSADPGLASEVLRLSNSALFGVSRRVGSLRQAVALLGLRRVRDLVITRYMVQAFSRMQIDAIDMSHFWRRSVGTAVVATRLAAAKGSKRQDEIGMAGLLADVGVVLFALAAPDPYRPIAEQYRPLGGDDWIAHEQSRFGFGHAEVAARLLDQWFLPDVLVNAIRYHHHAAQDMPSDRPGAELAPLIDAAQVVASGLCEARDPRLTASRIARSFDQIGLDPHQFEAILSSVESDVLALSAVLKVDVIPAHAYHLIAEKVAEHCAAAPAPFVTSA